MHWFQKQGEAHLSSIMPNLYQLKPELSSSWPNYTGIWSFPEPKMLCERRATFSLISVRNAADICVKKWNARKQQSPAASCQRHSVKSVPPPLDSNYTGIIKLTFKTEDQWNLLHANMGRFRGVMSLNREEKTENQEICNKCWVWYWSGWVCTEQWTWNVFNHRPANEK